MLKETMFNKSIDDSTEIGDCFYDNQLILRYTISNPLSFVSYPSYYLKIFFYLIIHDVPSQFMKHPVYKSLMFYNLPTLSQFYISPSHYMFHILNRNCNVYSKCFIDCHVVKAYCVRFFIS